MTDYSDIMNQPRPALHHRPMDIAHRAKIFAPFAALKGYEESIQNTAAQREQEVEFSYKAGWENEDPC